MQSHDRGNTLKPYSRTSQERLERNQDSLHAVDGRPFILQNIQANCPAIDINVRMVAWRFELDRRRDIRVVRRKGDRYTERQASVYLRRGVKVSN